MVYLIHFEIKLCHAQHYIGFVEKNLKQRIQRHRDGQGARILRAANAAGINWEVVRVWEDADKTFERKLKNKKNASKLCPLCKHVTTVELK